MATLTSPHWEAVPSDLRRLMATLGRLPTLRPFYLAGGTALALRFGHRISRDLDLFANIDTLDTETRFGIVQELRKSYTLELLQDSVFGLVLQADGQPASFFSYGYPLLAPSDLVSGIRIASILDIGLMKMDAIAGRGTRKDFYDLYVIAAQVSLKELFAHSEAKYAETRSFGMRVLTALVDFDIAEQQDDPILLQPIEWDQVRAFFLEQARQLGQDWLGQDR